jgi:carbon-monoxide dehydrogenase medium subunit
MDLLHEHRDSAKILAGGQSLVPVLNLRLASPSLLIDLNRIPEIAGISIAGDGSLVAGAMTRHRAFERSAIVGQTHPLVQHAAGFIAHAQVRNRGTIGGSLCHADPAAEWPAICLVSEAEITLASAAGKRILAAEDFSLGVYTTALRADEILVSVRFPRARAGSRWGFEEVSRRHGDFAIVGVACLLNLDASGDCTAARIVVFGAGDRPTLVPEAAFALIGTPLDAQALASAARIARERVEARSDHHASDEYRSELVEVLTRRALIQALARTVMESQ